MAQDHGFVPIDWVLVGGDQAMQTVLLAFTCSPTSSFLDGRTYKTAPARAAREFVHLLSDAARFYTNIRLGHPGPGVVGRISNSDCDHGVIGIDESRVAIVWFEENY